MDDLSRQPAPLRLRDLARVLRRRAVIAFFTFAMVVIVANVLTARMKPLYEATTRLLIDSPTNNSAAPASVLDLLRSGGGGSNLDVEIEKIKSRDFLKRVVAQSNLPAGTPPEYLMGNIALSSGTGGQILVVSVRAHTAEEAQKVANTIATLYIDETRHEFDDKSDLSEERLRRARDEAAAEKERAEKAYNSFTSHTGLSDPGIFYRNQAEKTVAVKNALADQQKNLPLMEKSLSDLREHLTHIPAEFITGYPLNKNSVIDSYQDEITRLETKRRDLKIDYADDSLEVQEVDRLIADRKKALVDIQSKGTTFSIGSKGVARNPDYSKVQSQIFDTEIGIKSARESIAALQKQLAGLESEQQAMAQQQTQYDMLRRARDSAAEAYDRTRSGMLAIKQSRLTSAPYIHVLDEAQLPGGPLSPKPLLNNVLAIAVGLLLGIASALFAEILSGGTLTDDSTEALPRVGGVPLLGAVPAFLPAPLEAGQSLAVALNNGGNGVGKSIAAEDALREIGYVLAHREAREAAPVVILTGTRSDETTAVLAAQMTATLVREGLRVTLVDADQITPRLHEVFGAPDAPGLTDALAKRRPVEDILHVGAEGRLRFLAAGTPDTVPMTEKNLRRVFKRLADSAHTDIVVVSGPSVWSARLISPLERAASGIVLITSDNGDHNGATPEESVARVRRVLSNGHTPRLLGVVVSKGAVGTLAALAAPSSPPNVPLTTVAVPAATEGETHE